MTKRESSILKGIAIMLMLVHHLFYADVIYETMDIRFFLLNREQLIWFGMFGKACVALFVFVTGYGITKSMKAVSAEKLGTYIIKRYVKLIFPFLFIYLLALIAAAISGMLVNTYGSGLNMLYHAVVDALGLANLLGTPTLNGTWWYMSLAVTLIVLVPLINIVCNRFGVLGTILLGILVPVYIGNNEADNLRWYMMSAVVGVICARESSLDQLRAWCNTLFKRIVLLVVSLFGIIFLGEMCWQIGHYWILDAVIALFFAILVSYIGRIPLVSTLLSRLGKHSMNIFLTHSFLFYYYCRGFIYGFHYPILIYLALLLTSLALSIVIELLKKAIRFEKLEKAVIAKLCGTNRTAIQQD